MAEKNLTFSVARIATKNKQNDKQLFVDFSGPDEMLGGFFYLIEIESPWVDGKKIKDLIVSIFNKNGEKKQKDLQTEFENKIKNINDALSELANSGEHEWIGKLNAIIGQIIGGEIIFSQSGRISGYLFRDNKINHITERSPDGENIHPLKTFESMITGGLVENDRVVISNDSFFSHMSLDRLRQMVSTFGPNDSILEISKSLRRSKIKDVNTIVINLSSNESEDKKLADPKLPDVIFLDDIIEPTITKAGKIGAKYISQLSKTIAKTTLLLTKTVVASVSSKIKNRTENNHRPKLEKTGGENNSPFKQGSPPPKINHFNRKNKKANILQSVLFFLNNLLFWGKNILKPENRKFLFIGLIIILLFFGFIKIKINNNKNGNLNDQSESIEGLDNARTLYSKALNDIGLGKKEGKDELIKAKDAAEKAKINPSVSSEANNLLTQIQQKLDEINIATRLANGSEANYEFENDSISVIAVGRDLYSFSETGKISKLDSQNKKISTLTTVDSSYGKIKRAHYTESQNAFFVATESNFLLKFNLNSNTIEKIQNAGSEKWGNFVALSSFSTNLYLLDSDAGKIQKHTFSDSGYSAASSYVTKTPISINDSADLAIDGDVYVLKNDGTVVKITKGVENTNYAVATPPTPDDKIVSANKILTSVDSGSLYIFDKGTNRVLEYTKAGAYKRQFVVDKEVPLSTLTINTKINKLWLVSEKKVFEFDL